MRPVDETTVAERTAEAETETPKRRGPGRPKGRKDTKPRVSYKPRARKLPGATEPTPALASLKAQGAIEAGAQMKYPPRKSPYVKKPDWKLDMTPVSSVLTKAGMDLIPEERRDMAVCQLTTRDRQRVGLVREYDPNSSLAGRPKGYVPASVAYTVVSTLSLKDVQKIADGERPEDPKWPEDRVVTMQYVRAAREQLAAGARGTPSEINNRTDGLLVQEVRTHSVSFVVEVPAVPSVEDWQTMARREYAGSDDL